MKQLTKITAIFDRTLALLAILAGVVIIFIMLSVLTEIVMRDFLNRPQTWVVELSEYALLWITFLGTAWLLKREGHVKMDMVLNRLNPGRQVVLNIITSVIGLIICLVTTWYGVQMTWSHFQRGIFEPTTVLDLPKAPIMVIIPIGFFLLSIQFLRRTYGYVGRWRASRDKEQGL